MSDRESIDTEVAGLSDKCNIMITKIENREDICRYVRFSHGKPEKYTIEKAEVNTKLDTYL